MAVFEDISRTLEELVGNGDAETVRQRLAEYDVRDVQAVWVSQWPGHPKPLLPPTATPAQIVKALVLLDLVTLK